MSSSRPSRQLLFCLPQLRNQFVLATRLTSSGLILAIRTLNINQRTSHYGVLILFRVLMARTRPLRVNLAANTNRLRSCGKQNNNWRAYLSSRRTTRRLCRKYWPLIRTCCIQITTFWSLQSGKTTTTYTNMCCIYVLRQEVVFRPSLALKWPFK